MTIKAIQTQYKGYHFRSRLEARWAVFFDALGLEWQYEPEGFDLGDGVYYLPDFRLLGVDTNGDTIDYWFDVKPDGVSISDSDMEKMQRFADKKDFGYAGGFAILDGLPDINKNDHLLSPSAHEPILAIWSYRARPWWIMESSVADEMIWLNRTSKGKYHMGSTKEANWYEDGIAACIAARSARFEHGESGATL